VKTKLYLLNIAFLIVLSLFTTLTNADTGDSLREAEDKRVSRMQWWKEARFGMFIHWGIYSVPAGVYKGKPIKGSGEWLMDHGKIPIPEYEEFAKQFNPQKFDAEEWVKIAKGAGMKYIVITSKHHDGFSLWDSKVSGYDVIDFAPFKRNILRELEQACEKEGIRLCFYYSIMDWHHPDAKGDRFPKYREEYMKPQLKELLTDYGNIGVLWFDGEWIGEWTESQGKDLYSFLHKIKPDLIINNRIGKGRIGMQGMSKSPDSAGDFGTPEQEIPATGLPGVDWESCMTMNDTWGYRSDDHRWKSAQQLIHQLVDITSKGGNFLLNVGPTAEGLIPQPSVERLTTIGEWLRTNGEAIYGTNVSLLDKPSWGRYTTKTGRIYAHILNWPKDAIIIIPTRTLQVSKVYLLADKEQNNLKTATTDQGLVISLPGEAPDSIDTVVVIEYK
jgi:alpha-L-fucosidase